MIPTLILCASLFLLDEPQVKSIPGWFLDGPSRGPVPAKREPFDREWLSIATLRDGEG